MTNIDHDALARRIAIAFKSHVLIHGGLISDWDIQWLANHIASTLREALPTSEDAIRLLFLLGCIRGNTPLVELIRGLNETTLDECRRLIDLAMNKPEDEES